MWPPTKQASRSGNVFGPSTWIQYVLACSLCHAYDSMALLLHQLLEVLQQALGPVQLKRLLGNEAHIHTSTGKAGLERNEPGSTTKHLGEG